MKHFPLVSFLLVALLAAGLSLPPGSGPQRLAAQNASKKKSRGKRVRQASTKAIDIKAQRAQDAYLRQIIDLAGEYEKAGDLDKSKRLLKTVLTLRPGFGGVRKKIAQLDEEQLGSNELIFEVDASQGWGNARAIVQEGRPIRVRVAGQYRFVTNLPLGPAGFPSADPNRDIAAGIRCGALMGVVVPPQQRGKAAKPGKPFSIGSGGQITPGETGMLYLRVNAPPGHKCSGRLRVRLTGYLRKP